MFSAFQLWKNFMVVSIVVLDKKTHGENRADN